MKRTSALVAIALSVITACVVSRSGAEAATVHRYRCVGDALAATTLAVHNPGSGKASWKQFVRDGGAAVSNELSLAEFGHQTTVTNFALAIDVEVTSRQVLIITAVQGAGDAIHTLRCK